MSSILMEKIAPLKSLEISEKLFIFKTHLSFIEKGWLPMDGNVIVNSFQSSTGHNYSTIIHHQVDNKLIVRMDFFIDDAATLEEIDIFLDEVLKGKNEANFSSWFVMNMQTRYFDDIVRGVIQRLYFHFEKDPSKFDHNMMASPTTEPGQISLPQGYTLSPLLEDHADGITKQWALDIGFDDASYDSLQSMVLANITQRPCFGIFTKSDPTNPIAWLGVYGGGSIGQLHVKECHRGRGLARILLRNTLNIIQNIHGIECRIHACAEKTNTASLNLLLSQGWQLQPFNHKIILFRKTGEQ